nr:segregation/condensation protein A [Wenjunlia tyrosinilytica]
MQPPEEASEPRGTVPPPAGPRAPTEAASPPPTPVPPSAEAAGPVSAGVAPSAGAGGSVEAAGPPLTVVPPSAGAGGSVEAAGSVSAGVAPSAGAGGSVEAAGPPPTVVPPSARAGGSAEAAGPVSTAVPASVRSQVSAEGASAGPATVPAPAGPQASADVLIRPGITAIPAPARPQDESGGLPLPSQPGGEPPGDLPEPSQAVGAETPGDAPADGDTPADRGRFKVRLHNFEGPFDLLLQLIAKHKLDVTEVALSKVTDEFIAFIRAMGPDWDLDQATEFLVVAATLLDLKAARLLPSAEVEDEEDLALLEARDLLFARLLQYRAYKQIAAIFADRWAEELSRHPRTVGLEPHHAELLPEVVISIGPEGFAKLAAKAMIPKPRPTVYVEHIHAPLVSVREQAELVMARLRDLGQVSFGALTEDAPDTLTVVARFLALLELYREKAVALDQDEALGELLVRWTGDDDHQPVVTDEFDRAPDVDDEDRK